MEHKPTVTSGPRPKKYVITRSNGAPSKGVEIAGLPIEVTAENVNDPNIVRALQNFEKRAKRKIFGVYIRHE